MFCWTGAVRVYLRLQLHILLRAGRPLFRHDLQLECWRQLVSTLWDFGQLILSHAISGSANDLCYRYASNDHDPDGHRNPQRVDIETLGWALTVVVDLALEVRPSNCPQVYMAGHFLPKWARRDYVRRLSTWQETPTTS